MKTFIPDDWSSVTVDSALLLALAVIAFVAMLFAGVGIVLFLQWIK